MFAKMQIEGLGTGLEKHDWLKIINGRAADLYRDASARSFTKTIIDDEVGKLLYKAMKAAKGPEIEGDASKILLSRNRPNPSALLITERMCSPWITCALIFG
jgi:hypothetical protein